MRILHLANHLHEIGNGIMNVAVDLACRQAELGHTVAVASAGGSYVPLVAEHGVEHFDLPQPWRHPLALARSALRMRELFSSWRPDIVHAHMMTGAILARTLRDQARSRLITTVHNEWQRSSLLMGVGDRVIAVSAATAEAMRRRGIPRRKLAVVRNGPLNSPRQAGRHPEAAGPVLARPSILFVGGLYQRKGVPDLIEAFASLAAVHREANLYIVGDGPDRDRFQKAARAILFADRIHFKGFQKDPNRYFRQADIFVLPSLSEPFGLVLAEAREAGCAIVASDVGGIPEVLDGGRAGILVPPGRPDRLGEALRSLLSDTSARQAWSARARHNLGWLQTTRLAAETLAVYEAALTGPPMAACERSGPAGLEASAQPQPLILGKRQGP